MNQKQWDAMVDGLVNLSTAGGTRPGVPRAAAEAALMDMRPPSHETTVATFAGLAGCSLAIAESVLADLRRPAPAKAQDQEALALAERMKPVLAMDRRVHDATVKARKAAPAKAKATESRRLARPAAADTGGWVELDERGPDANMGNIVRTKGGKR